MTDHLNHANNWYMPVGIFSVVVIIAALIGAWNGWKTALYFLVWNVIATLVIVLTMDQVIDALANVLKDKIDVKESTTITALFSAAVLFGALLVVNLIAFSFYWIFRRKLKRTIKENKATGKSNGFARWMGAGVGVITALPVTLTTTAIVNVTSSNAGVDAFFNSMLKGITGGKLKGVESDDKEAISLLLDEAFQDNISNIFDGSKNSQISVEDQQVIANLINNPKGLEIIKSVATKHSGDKTTANDFIKGLPAGLSLGSKVTDVIARKKFVDIVFSVGIKLSPGENEANVKANILNKLFV